MSVAVGCVAERIDGAHPLKIVVPDPRATGLVLGEIVLSAQGRNDPETIRDLSATVLRDKAVGIYCPVHGGGRYGN